MVREDAESAGNLPDFNQTNKKNKYSAFPYTNGVFGQKTTLLVGYVIYRIQITRNKQALPRVSVETFAAEKHTDDREETLSLRTSIPR